jgi:hypothetical protein
MSHLVDEILLRLAKAGIALVVAIVLFGVLIGPLGVTATAEVALLSWLSAAALILLVETSPFS